MHLRKLLDSMASAPEPENADACQRQRFRFLRQFGQGITIPACLGPRLSSAGGENPSILPSRPARSG